MAQTSGFGGLYSTAASYGVSETVIWSMFRALQILQSAGMKIAEALSRRSTLQKDLAWIRDQLSKLARVPEGSAPLEDPQEMLQRMESDAEEYQQLLASLNRTNLAVTDAQGQTMTAMLARRDALRATQSILSDFYLHATAKEEVYGRQELRYVPSIDVVALRKRLEAVNEELLNLNMNIQQLNWEADLQ